MDREHWNLERNHRINGLEFGRDRALILEELGEPVRSFKERESNSIVEVYHSFHVYYSSDDKFEAIEFYGKGINLSIDSQPVFPGTLSAARKILPDLEYYYGSYISKSASIGIGAEDDNIISILAGCKGYYL